MSKEEFYENDKEIYENEKKILLNEILKLQENIEFKFKKTAKIEKDKDHLKSENFEIKNNLEDALEREKNLINKVILLQSKNEELCKKYEKLQKDNLEFKLNKKNIKNEEDMKNNLIGFNFHDYTKIKRELEEEKLNSDLLNNKLMGLKLYFLLCIKYFLNTLIYY